MKFSVAASVAALAGTTLAFPQLQLKHVKRNTTGCDAPVTLSGNPFLTKKLHANSFYKSEVLAAAGNLTDASLAGKAKKFAEFGSFLWMDSIANIERAAKAIPNVPCAEVMGLVVYNLPGRDCAAKASNGEIKAGDLAKYKTEYIDPIAAMIKKNSNVAFALIIEPDSLPNLITNTKDYKTCASAEPDYTGGVEYAFKTLDLPNVVQYLDAGHGGWLGWTDNLKPAAELFAKVYKAAGSPKSVRGFSTNVSGYNAYSQNPGEFEKDKDGQYNKAADEERYIGLIGAEMKTAGFPNNAITDTSRNGVTGIRKKWGDFCNVKGSGAGMRPGLVPAGGNHTLTDAFVWVKPAGESDGTSDSKAKRFDSSCVADDSVTPMPEAGTWSQVYFEQIVKNAVPPITY